MLKEKSSKPIYSRAKYGPTGATRKTNLRSVATTTTSAIASATTKPYSDVSAVSRTRKATEKPM